MIKLDESPRRRRRRRVHLRMALTKHDLRWFYCSSIKFASTLSKARTPPVIVSLLLIIILILSLLFWSFILSICYIGFIIRPNLDANLVAEDTTPLPPSSHRNVCRHSFVRSFAVVRCFIDFSARNRSSTSSLRLPFLPPTKSFYIFPIRSHMNPFTAAKYLKLYINVYIFSLPSLRSEEIHGK